MDAWIDEQKALGAQEPSEAGVASLIVIYWKERGMGLVNADQTGRSLRTFLAFLAQDRVGIHAVVNDLIPATMERFRAWRMKPHEFQIPWFGETYDYASKGVSGATVQRNINDLRAAVNHAQANNRIPVSPRIRDIEAKFKSPHRDRVLTEDELARIMWYSRHNADFFRFIALQMMTSVRPMAALEFDPVRQYDDRRGLIDLQPTEALATKKRNAIIPAARPMRPILRAWQKAGAVDVASRKTRWRIMRRVLDLSPDVHAKTIRHTIATWLYEMEWVPERQISEMLGHADETGLARTSRIYAKYRPDKMGKVVKGLEVIWLRIARLSKAYGSDHSLTTGQRGDPLKVVRKSGKC